MNPKLSVETTLIQRSWCLSIVETSITALREAAEGLEYLHEDLETCSSSYQNHMRHAARRGNGRYDHDHNLQDASTTSKKGGRLPRKQKKKAISNFTDAIAKRSIPLAGLPGLPYSDIPSIEPFVLSREFMATRFDQNNAETRARFELQHR